MKDGYNTSEHERIMAGMIRYGVITGLDLSDATAPRCKVSTGGLDSEWLPWLTLRAGKTKTWSAPDIGEQGLVISQSGDPSQGVVLVGLFSSGFPAPVTDPNKDHTVFPDGTTVEHDSGSNTYAVTVAGTGNWIVNCKHATVNADDDATVNTKAATINADDSATVNTATATVKASTSVMVDTPTATFTGIVNVAQALNVGGLFTFTAGMAGSGTGPGGKTAQMNGDMEVINGHSITTDSGDIVAGGKSLENHVHIEYGAGSETSPPI